MLQVSIIFRTNRNITIQLINFTHYFQFNVPGDLLLKLKQIGLITSM